MILQDFFTYMRQAEVLSHVGLDDFADKLSFIYSVWFLLVCSSLATAKNYFASPIVCYLPSIVGSHEGQSSYVNSICYSEGTYNFLIDSSDPDWDQPYRSRKIFYYQWLPLVLGLQGALLYSPRIVWQVAVARCGAGVNLLQLVRSAREAAAEPLATKVPDGRREKLLSS
uniref:Innexin n=1 Tax=Macrostomum lignano TaxID=282301 RepID=A0A1I8GQ62_9PLAT